MALKISSVVIAGVSPAGTQYGNDVVPTSRRRNDVALTSVWRHLDVIGLSGSVYIINVIFHVYHLIVYACFYTNHIIYMYMRF